MLVPFIIVAVIAAGLLASLVLARQRATGLRADLGEAISRTEATEGELATVSEQRREAEERATELSGRVEDLTSRNGGLTERIGELDSRAAELTRDVKTAEDTLRKRTELADAQATQIDSLSAARDELQVQITAAEEQIATLSARPGVVVGESADDPGAETLWELEVARSERSWRTSVAINPIDDASPFDGSDDPVRTAVEIEAAALREDVGALIGIEWKAQPIESPARRILVVRVAQEMLASASRAPGAARLVVSDEAGDGSIDLTFEPDDDAAPTINLLPPAPASPMIDVTDSDMLSVRVRAE